MTDEHARLSAAERKTAVETFFDFMSKHGQSDNESIALTVTELLTRYQTNSDTTGIVRSPTAITEAVGDMSGKVILPTTTDMTFATIWFALLEYKTLLETSIVKMMQQSQNELLNEKYELEPWRAFYVDNTPENLEDQAFLYETLTKVAALLNEYTARARKLSLF